MKIVPKERIKAGGEYKRAGQVCDVPEDVGKALVEGGKAEKAAGRPSGGKAEAEKPGAEGTKGGGE